MWAASRGPTCWAFEEHHSIDAQKDGLLLAAAVGAAGVVVVVVDAGDADMMYSQHSPALAIVRFRRTPGLAYFAVPSASGMHYPHS